MDNSSRSETYVYNNQSDDIERVKLIDTSSSLKLGRRSRNAVKIQRKASRSRKFVVFVCCLLQIMLGNGISFGLSVMYAELVVVFNAKRADAALVQSLNIGIGTGAGILYAGVIRTYGPGKCIAVATLISSIAFFVSAFSNSIWMVIFFVGVVAGFCLCINYFGAFVAISLTFSEESSFFLMSVTCGASIGQFIVPFLYELFISQYTWSGAFMLMAGVLLNCLPFALIMHTSRDFFHKSDTTEKNQSKASAFCDVTLLTDYIIWILWTNFLLLSIAVNVEAWFIVDHAVSLGLSRSSGSLMASAIGLGGLIGRITASVIRLKCTSIPTLYHWLYMFVILAALHVFVTNMVDFVSLLIGCFCIGISMGITASQVPAIMFEASGLDKYPQAMAVVNVMYGLGDFLSAFGGGYIKDAFGKYDLVFYGAAVISLYVCLTTVFVLYKLRVRKQKEDDLKQDSTSENQTLLD